jgi:ribosome-associated protein
MPKTPSQAALAALSKRPAPALRAELRAGARDEGADDSRLAAQHAGRAALEKKGDDVLLLDLRGLSGYADFLVLASGSSDRQLEAIADGVEKALREQGRRPVGTEGTGGGRWVLLDYSDVVVHVFHEDERHYYDLEGLWADAPRERIADAAKPAPAPALQ